jgi:hypothetical protein
MLCFYTNNIFLCIELLPSIDLHFIVKLVKLKYLKLQIYIPFGLKYT